jgi:hypothetical protein
MCAQFAVDLNTTEAAVSARYGKTPSARNKRAGFAAIRASLAATSRLVAERAGMKQIALLAELAAIARSRIADVLDVKDGDLTVKDLSELTDEHLGAIEAVD